MKTIVCRKHVLLKLLGVGAMKYMDSAEIDVPRVKLWLCITLVIWKIDEPVWSGACSKAFLFPNQMKKIISSISHD